MDLRLYRRKMRTPKSRQRRQSQHRCLLAYVWRHWSFVAETGRSCTEQDDRSFLHGTFVREGHQRAYRFGQVRYEHSFQSYSLQAADRKIFLWIQNSCLDFLKLIYYYYILYDTVSRPRLRQASDVKVDRPRHSKIPLAGKHNGRSPP